jgi:hypothetical protein
MQDSPSDPVVSAPRNVLVIDDDPVARQAIGAVLVKPFEPADLLSCICGLDRRSKD